MIFGNEILSYDPSSQTLDPVARIVSIQPTDSETRDEFVQRLTTCCAELTKPAERAAVNIAYKRGKPVHAEITITPVQTLK